MHCVILVFVWCFSFFVWFFLGGGVVLFVWVLVFWGLFYFLFFSTSGIDNFLLKERGVKAIIKLIVVFVLARKAS